ncbi:MAG: multiheme c-type cytochrome [Acidobacteriota bacterium]
MVWDPNRHLILLGLLALATCCLSCGEDQPLPPPLEIVPGQLTSAERCKECHADIYGFWRGSGHAEAATNPTFRQAWTEAVEALGDEAGHLCLRCHAPAVVVNQDYGLTDRVTVEGVTCDFCHSLTALGKSGAGSPFVLDVGAVKYGPVRDAHSTGHAVAYSEFHDSSEQCAGCHEYTSDQGVPVLTTYSEWEAWMNTGGNRSCQKCHMPLVLANIVDPKVKRVLGGMVNTHSTPGGHSKIQLARALRLRILELKQVSDGVRVQVDVQNTGAGHQVPTGSPTRKVLLTVTAVAGDRREVQSREYQRILHDSAGQPVMRDSLVFTNAAGVLQDTRLKPGESRIENFHFPLPPGGNVEVTATLTYLYSPQQRPETETRIDFLSETRRLTVSWERAAERPRDR